MLLKRLVISSLLVSLAVWPAVTRPRGVQAAPRAPRVQAPPQLTTEHELSLLDEVISEAAALRLAENRALVQASAADLLWSFDERRARALFDEAVTNLGQINAAAPRDELERDSLLRAYEEVRREALQIAARRDPRLARALLRTTAGPVQGTDDGPNLGVSIALQVAADDPDLAAGLAAETLKLGISGELPELVLRLQSRDGRVAAKLADAVTTRLQSSSLLSSANAAQVALDLLRIGSESASSRIPLLDQSSLRALADELITESVRSQDDDGLLLALEPLLPIIDRYAPTRAPLVRRRLARIKAAGETGDSAADGVAGGTAGDDVTSSPGRDDREAGAGRTAAAPVPEDRVAALIESAKAMTARDEKRRAAESLEEAYSLIGVRARSLSQLCEQLQIAGAFAPLDAARGLGIAASAVDQINELADAAVVVDGFITEAQIARDGELVLKAVSGYLSAFPEEGVEGLAMLARAKFDGLRRIADRLQRAELRIMARLLILRSVMSPSQVVNLRAAGVRPAPRAVRLSTVGQPLSGR